MDNKIITDLARKIIEADTIGSSATHIAMCASSVSNDKFIKKHNEGSIKKEIYKIKNKLYKINEYVEELESHIYDGEISDGQL